MDLAATLETTLTGLGYELVDWERDGSGLLRIYIDSPRGIAVEDCVLVSNQLTRLFAVENIDYDRLEVSSPGLDRPLKKLADYLRFEGHEAQLKLRMPIEGQRRFVGVLKGATEIEVMLEVNGELKRFAFANVEKARLKPEV
ncbi:MAG TPA: ribosome maturation factor RimP [Burkholderiales bacterium]|nr:ribosome maturation factor RimP [Burkholderiales bacterium]